ncbi:MAG: hypothetical protein HKP13_10865 [Gammaproteobacteria bacterium]|nr:hypothetical protein [Gammaproteobacteria bacterium]
MHFEILVENKSGKKMLEELVPKILEAKDTCNIFSFKGLGHLPKNLDKKTDPNKRILLARLPMLLQSYGKTFSNYPPNYPATVIVVCDLDKRNRKAFHNELLSVLNSCDPAPETRFCLAIEEGEAWLLGDLAAIKAAYPKARNKILKGYVNDSICGTWEKLADAVYPGGAKALSARGWQTVGIEKFKWAENISPHMNVDENHSPSFIRFRDNLQNLSRKNAATNNDATA